MSEKANEFLKRKKGIDVPDGEELFHMLYNPHFNEWKSKRQEYIKYETLIKKKGKQRTHRVGDQYASTTSNFMSAGADNQNVEDFKQRQRDQYYMKEVRTFDEVFKAIKKETNENKKQRAENQINSNQVISEDEDENNEEDGDEDDDVGVIPEGMLDLDEQDIDDEDRQVLNDRILGIINVFQNVV